jgi:inosine-uridine nucleoside N-ribohydrolase
VKVWFDMETQDPDDVLALALVASHPACSLVGVSVTPGCHNQVGLAHEILRRVGRPEIPIGGKVLGHPKNCVAGFYYKHFGQIPPRVPHGDAGNLLGSAVQSNPDLTVVTGAAVTHLAESLPYGTVSRWVGQGGFAGDDVVPESYRLPKFAGKITCPTFNFNANPKAAVEVLASSAILKRILVSKNVCHGVVYDRILHDRLSS